MSAPETSPRSTGGTIADSISVVLLWLRNLSWTGIKRDAVTAFRWAREALSPIEDPAEPDIAFMSGRRLVGTGRLIVLAFIVCIFGWGAFAPLSSAILAPGVLVVASHVKSIQHLEGGIVRNIYVKDGQSVRTGQVLVRLDDTQAKAALKSLMDENDALAAQEARLTAERDGKQTIAFPPDLQQRAADPAVAQAMLGEQHAFDARRDTLAQQIDILSKRTEENDAIIAGLRKEQASVEKQLSLIAREISGVQELYDKGLSTLPRLLALQRQSADLAGQSGQLTEKIAQTELSSGENKLQIMNLKNQTLSDVVKDLRDVQTKHFDLIDRIQAARDVLARLTVRAPNAGKVANLTVHTNGQVIRPGDPIMDIVPQRDALEVEAHVRPEDADSVRIGMGAKVNLSAYQGRRLPMITGIVRTISADRQVDQRSGQAYFTVSITVDRAPLAAYPDVKLMPGLPVEVALNTGSRTALDYLTEPITDVFRRGMKER